MAAPIAQNFPRHRDIRTEIEWERGKPLPVSEVVLSIRSLIKGPRHQNGKDGSKVWPALDAQAVEGIFLFFVGASGLEPELRAPKARVLPLHHAPNCKIGVFIL